MNSKNHIVYEREGQAQGSVSNIIVLIVGVGVAVLVLIFVGVLGGKTYEQVESDIDEIYFGSAVNDSFTGLQNIEVNLSNSPILDGTLYLVHTSGVLRGINMTGNFNIDYALGSMTLTNASMNNTVFNATYDHGNLTIQNHIKTSIISGFEAVEETGELLPIIVLAVVITLVLGLVIATFAFGGLGGGGGRGSTVL